MEPGPDLLAAIDLLPELMLFTSTDGEVLSANSAFVREVRLPREDLIGRSLSELVTDEPAALQEYLMRCARSGQLLFGSVTIRRGDRAPVKCRAAGAAFRPVSSAQECRAVLLRLIPASESGSAFIALNEKLQQLNGEIARRRQTEATLREERETLQVTLSSIGDAVIVTDALGNVSFLNPVAEQLLGHGSGEARGRPLLEVFRIAQEETLQPVEDPVQQVIRSGSIVGLNDHTVLIRADGTRIPIDDSAAPIRLGDTTIGAVLIFRDISARRQAEQSLIDADRRKDEFLATLAHELRNPLAPIRNGLQLMASTEHDPERVASVRTMVDRQVRHMARLIDDLMDVSRITQGRLDLRQERVELDSVIQIAVETSRPLLQSRRQKLRIQPPASGICVYADVTRLAQVFSNLLNNSAKYSAPESEISITTEREGHEVVVSVRDTGIGIAPDMLGRVFDMFVQLNGAHARDGLGIGLTLVKRIIELHGGKVEAHSEGEGRGSAFRVRLSVVEPDAGITEPAAVQPAQSAGIRARILVADDNRDAAQTLGWLIEMAGHDVRVAHDGPGALELAEQFRPDVAVLDIGMPGMDGYQAAQHIRKRPWGGEVFLIALTGWGQEVDRIRAAQAGFDRHVVKPVDPQVLIGLITQGKREAAR